MIAAKVEILGGMENAKTNGNDRMSLLRVEFFRGAGFGTVGQEQAAQSAGDGELRLGRRENAYGGLFESKGEGAQDFRRLGSLRAAVARGGQRSDHVCDERGFEGGREGCACGRLYDFHDSRREQVDADRQQENGRVGDSLSRRGLGSGARGYESRKAAK